MALEKVGRYEIAGELGRGAMAVVYKATDPNIGRTVALKTMRLDAHGLDADEMLRRFKNEARAAGVMNHPNIVTIYDANEGDGLFYIAMEYVQGRTLHSMIQERQELSAERIIDITRQVCAGLDYAHGVGVIHRDIKPANIMITANGVVKIMDFGIAKSGGSMTSTGQVLGTPNYMSPEQVKGKPLDGRTDLFSYGVILYEMVTGEKPFTGQNVTTIVYKIVNESPIPARDLDVSVHPGLSAIISKALAKSPEERYQRGSDLADDVENYQNVDGSGKFIARSAAQSGEQSTATALARQLAPTRPIATSAPSSVLTSEKLLQQNMGRNTPLAPLKTQTHLELNYKRILPALSLLLLISLVTYRIIQRHPSAQSPQGQQQIAAPTSQRPGGLGASPQTPISDETSGPAQGHGIAKSADNIPPPVKPIAKGGEIRFGSTPAGASVEIDGHSDPTWTTPFLAKQLKTGTHELNFKKEGFVPQKRTIEVVAGKSAYNVRLAPATASLSISSDPVGASIEIDGENSGKFTPADIAVPPGDHRITVRKDGFHTVSTVVTLKAGQTFSFPPKLNPNQGGGGIGLGGLKKLFGSGVPGGKGVLNLKTDPPGARIIINGITMPKATPARWPLNAGNYDVIFTMPGFKPAHRPVRVVKGKNTDIREQLQPQ